MKQYTRLAILQSFEHLLEDRSFDKLTVAAIIKDCGISRNTFYYHFQDIYDLLNAWLFQQLGNYVQHSDANTLPDNTKALLHACVERKNVINNIMNSLSRDQLERYMFNYSNDFIYGFVQLRAGDRPVPQERLQELADFCRYVVAGYFLRFLWNDMRDDIDSSVDWTSPPLWLIPCTSACLRLSPAAVAASPMMVAIVRIPCPPTPASMMSFFIVYFLFLSLRWIVCMHSRRGMMTETPLYSISSRMIRVISSMFFGRGTTTLTCSGERPSPMHMASNLFVPAESCPPVIAVVRLSEIMTVILALSFMASRRPVIPECVKVESPITAIAGKTPASAAPFAMVMEAPISTQLSIARNGGKAPSV